MLSFMPMPLGGLYPRQRVPHGRHLAHWNPPTIGQRIRCRHYPRPQAVGRGPIWVRSKIRTLSTHLLAAHGASAHRKPLDTLVEALLSRETLNEQEILEVTGLPPAPALDTAMLPVSSAQNRSTPGNGS